MSKITGIFGWHKKARLQTSQAVFHRGRRRTVWIGGVLIFGGVMFVITTIADLIFRPHELRGIWETAWLTLSLLLWGLAGYIIGVFQWRRARRQQSR